MRHCGFWCFCAVRAKIVLSPSTRAESGLHEHQSSYSWIVRGRTIELEQDLGLPDGQATLVEIRPIKSPEDVMEGLTKSFGGWADDAEGLDEYLEWNCQQRKVSRSD